MYRYLLVFVVFSFSCSLINPENKFNRRLANRDDHVLPCNAVLKSLLESPTENPYWKDWNSSFISGEKSNFEKQWDSVERLKEEEDDQIIFLESLGFKFSTRDSLEIPDYYKLWDSLNRKIDQIIDSSDGKITEEDVLRPHRILYINGGLKFLPLSKFPLTPDLSEQRVKSGLLTEEEFHQMVREGKFLLGETKAGLLRGGGATDSEHELAHWGGFIRDPLYMKAARRLSSLSNKSQDEIGVKFLYLSWHFYEATTIVRKEALAELRSSSNQLFGSILEKVDDIEEIFFNSVKAEGEDEAPRLALLLAEDELKNAKKWMLPLGGATRDFFSRLSRRDDFNYVGNQVAFYSLTRSLEEKIRFLKSAMRDNQSELLEGKIKMVITEISRIRAYMNIMSSYEHSSFLTQVESGKIKDSFYYKLFCTSGIFKNSSQAKHLMKCD